MKNIQTARATVHGVEGLLIMGLLSTMLVVLIPMIGVKIVAALEPLRAVLG